MVVAEGLVDPSGCELVGMPRSHLPVSFAATYDAAAGLRYRRPCISGRTLESSVAKGSTMVWRCRCQS
jgi:hypothetical protein